MKKLHDPTGYYEQIENRFKSMGATSVEPIWDNEGNVEYILDNDDWEDNAIDIDT